MLGTEIKKLYKLTFKMKKIILIISALLAFACTKVETYIPQEVEFTNTITTKAIVEGTSMVDNFGVYGYYQTEDAWFMNNVEYNADGTVAGSEHYFWPGNSTSDSESVKVNFFTYSPYDASVSMSGNTITIPIDATGMNSDCKDLLYAYVLDSEPTESAVPLNFKHQLAWVRFQAKYTGVFSDVKVTSIKFKTNKLKANGSAEINTTNGNITVTPSSTTTDFEFSNPTLSLSDSYQNLSDVLVIPQNVPDQLVIKYTAKLGGTTYSNKTATITLPHTAFVAGKQYIYQINISIWEVIFAASTTDWDKQTPVEIY